MANTFAHIELNTTDVGKAKEFYGNLFDWQMQDVEMSPGFTYTMFRSGGTPNGGIMQHPMGGPSMWLPYVEVSDIHAATEKARSMGAHVIKDVHEVKGAGWLSIFIDPTGAVLGLWKQMS